MNDKMRRLSQRMSHISPFEVMEIQTLARQLEAEGKDVIHMEIGEPDFRTPEPIVEAAIQALRDEPMLYTSALGMKPLREAIAGFYETKYGVKVDASRIVVTAGSSAALLLTFAVLLNAGDEVLMADPGYPCNRHFVRTVDGVPVGIPVGPDTDYQLAAKHIAPHWGARTAATLVASPANPTGTIVTPAELANVRNEVARLGGTLVVDEIYQGLTYGVEPSTALTLGDDVFVINSFSKYFQMTGWRLGWLVVPPAYVRTIETLAQNLFISASAPAQFAALAAFKPQTIAILEARRAELHARRDFLIPALRKLGFGVPVVPQGAFYIYADSSALGPSSHDLSRRIMNEANVAVTPGNDFGSNEPQKHIRIAYTRPIARLEEAMGRIAKLGLQS